MLTPERAEENTDTLFTSLDYFVDGVWNTGMKMGMDTFEDQAGDFLEYEDAQLRSDEISRTLDVRAVDSLTYRGDSVRQDTLDSQRLLDVVSSWLTSTPAEIH